MKKLLFQCVVASFLWGSAQQAYSQAKDEVFTFNDHKYKVTGDNLITNGSFEDGLTGWTSGTGAELSTDKFEIATEGAQEGGKYLVPLAHENGEGAGSIGTAWEISSGKTYVYSFYLKNTVKANEDLQFLITSLTKTKNSETDALKFTPNPSVSATNEWTLYQVVFTNSDDYSYIQAKFRWLETDKRFGFDNFVLAEVTELPNTEGLSGQITKAEGMLDGLSDSPNTKEKLQAAITTAKGYEQSESPEDVFAQIETLKREMHYAELKIYDATKDSPVETDFVVNGTFDENTTTGWSYNINASGYNQGIAHNQTGDITGNFMESWKWESYTGSIEQSLQDLPNGVYVLKAATFRDQPTSRHGDAVYLFANDDKTIVTSANGHYYFVATNVTDGKLTFGVKSEKECYRWMGIDNVSLTYYGADATKTELATEYAKTEWDAAKAEGEQKKDSYNDLANASGKASQWKQQLDECLASSPSDIASYEEQRGKLMAAISNLDVVKPYFEEVEYAKKIMDVSSYESKMKDVGFDDFESLPNQLNVDEYKAVKENWKDVSETYIGNMGSWSGDMIDNKNGNQHWSGVNGTSYYEQTGDQWGAGSWAVYKEKKVTLPAGKYVLMAAGRSSADAVLKMSVDELVSQTFPNKNDTGLGIATDGTASFQEGTFANDNKGRGWEYRYCAFELDNAKEVTIRVDASATPKENWVSIADAALYTQDTEVPLNITAEDQWATLILPFGVEAPLPEGLKAYSCAEIAEGTSELTLTEQSSLKANTPYIVNAENGIEHTFKGLSTATQDEYTEGLLTGIFKEKTAEDGTYVLQNQKSGEGLGFYKVASGKEPTIKPYHAYITKNAVAGSNIRVLLLRGGTTGIEGIAAEDALVNVYGIDGILVRANVKSGRALEGLPKGIYIVNGAKKAVK